MGASTNLRALTSRCTLARFASLAFPSQQALVRGFCVSFYGVRFIGAQIPETVVGSAPHHGIDPLMTGRHPRRIFLACVSGVPLLGRVVWTCGVFVSRRGDMDRIGLWSG